MNNTRSLACLWTVCFCLAASARAEIIIDDFDDPVEVISPEMGAEIIESLGVGDLRARRTALIFGLPLDPIARLDASITFPSVLTGQFIDFHPRDAAGGISRYSIGYRFDQPYDVTEDGMNNAIILDVKTNSGANAPTILHAVLNLGADSLFVEFPKLASPRSIELPFSSFGGRGGGPPLGVSRGVEAMHFQFFVYNTGTPEKGGLFEIDRIRVGRVVPEPKTLWAWFSPLLLVLGSRSRVRMQRRTSCYDTARCYCFLRRCRSARLGRASALR